MRNDYELEMIIKLVEKGKITREEADDLMDAVVGDRHHSREDEYEAMALKAEKAFRNSMGPDEPVNEDDESPDRQTKHMPPDENEAFIRAQEVNLLAESDIYVKSNQRIGIIGRKSDKQTVFRPAENKQDTAVIKIIIDSEDSGRIDEIVQVKAGVGGLSILVDPGYQKPVGLDFTLPDRKLNKIIAHTENGNVAIKGISANLMEIETCNGRIHMSQSSIDEISAKTTNGKLLIEKCKGDNITASTTNAGILVTGCDVSNLIKAVTSNSGVAVMGSSCANMIMQGTNGGMRLENNRVNMAGIKTSNGRIFIKSNSVYDDRVVSIEGVTTSGNITVFAEHHMGVGFEVDAGRDGNIQLGKYLKPSSQRRNSGNIYYAEGESRDGRRANRYTELKLITGEGDISIDWD